MSPDVADLVEASNNIARVELKNGGLKILNLTRSSVESTKMAVAEQLKSVLNWQECKLTFRVHIQVGNQNQVQKSLKL